MKQREIFSKAWCDLLFQGRNKDYGAYKLRKNIGRRYRFALLIVLPLSTLTAIIPTGLNLYYRYRLVKALQEAEQELKVMKELEKKEPYEVKRLAAGRGAPKQTVIKDAAEDSPIITDAAKENIKFGVAGDETIIVEDVASFEDKDTLHNRDRADLPVEGAQLTATDVVEEMPQFPGGLTALMTWLDTNIPYPRSCIDKKVEGELLLRFFVDETGRAVEPEIIQSVHPDIDAAALRAIRRMPLWKPGKKNSRVTAVCITIPIDFRLK